MTAPSIRKLPSIQAHVAAVMAEMEANPRPRYTALPPQAFPAASVMAWLEWADKAGVPSVPGTVVATFPLEALLRFDEGGEASNAAMAELDRLNAARAPDRMRRWDCCAPLGIKQAMAHGGLACPARAFDHELHPGDPRAYDILFEYPADTVSVVERPWVQARGNENYPIEFRVFVQGGRVTAVSNYYVQRALPATEEILGWARQAATYAQRMVDVALAAGARPWLADPSPEAQKVLERFTATLDFLVAEDGRVLFLEGGPGPGFNAHPCCYWNPETREMAEVSGVRLGVEGPSHALLSE